MGGMPEMKVVMPGRDVHGRTMQLHVGRGGDKGRTPRVRDGWQHHEGGHNGVVRT